MLKYIIIICLFLNGCTTYKNNQIQKEIIKKQQSWLNIQYLAMKKPQLTNKKGTMKKNILVKFDLQIGEYEHQDSFIFNNKKTEYGYCKEFWNLNKKDELKENVFWDNQMLNAISVYSETEITNEQVKTLNELGVA